MLNKGQLARLTAQSSEGGGGCGHVCLGRNSEKSNQLHQALRHPDAVSKQGREKVKVWWHLKQRFSTRFWESRLPSETERVLA